MTLKSDGLSREAFSALWRDAMVATVDVAERARLVMELARLDLREFGRVEPLIVAVTDHDEVPFQLISLTGLVLDSDSALRDAVHVRLGPLGPLEAYVAFTMAAGATGGVSQFLLVVWGEGLDAPEVCWIKPFRHRDEHLDEARELQAPDPHATVFGPLLAGMLPRRH